MERDDELDRLRRLYPDLSDAELREIKETLERYFDLSVRIYERIRNDPATYEQFRKRLDERKKRDAA